MSESNTLFRGTDVSRLLVLMTIAVVGWVIVWRYWIYRESALAEAEPQMVVEDAPPAPIKPEDAPAFETVTDKTPVGFRDTAAYVLLLKRTHETSMNDLAREARRDVLFGHLVLHPKEYRGVPVHILGTVNRITREQSKQAKNGWLYTAWIVTPDSGRNPVACAFDEPPKGLPIGVDLNERVVFNGYFLKLMAYLAHNEKDRAAPLLVGRLGWTPPPGGIGGGKKADSNRPVTWLALAVGVMFVISFCRWIAGLRRTLAVRRAPSLLRDRPTDEIAPEVLATYLQNVDEEGEAPAEDDSSH